MNESLQKRIPIIDALRGLSCLGILLYHVRVDLWVGWWELKAHPEKYSSFTKAVSWLSIPTPFLGYAILLFFLISGFCIHYPQTTGSVPSWQEYFRRRFFRIYPPYLVALALTFSITLLCRFFWDDDTWDLGRALRVLTLTQNYPPEPGQMLSNPSLWTIPLEVEFYLLYPLVFMLFTRRLSLILALGSLSICALSIYLSQEGIGWSTFTVMFFWPVWLLGALCAKLYREDSLAKIPIWILLSFAATSASFAFWGKIHLWEFWLQYFLWSIFYLCLFVLCLRQSDFLENLNGFRTAFLSLSWLGTISFSAYLIHFPVFKLIGYLHKSAFGEKPANFLIPIIYLILVLGISWLFYRLVERPIHIWSKQTKTNK